MRGDRAVPAAHALAFAFLAGLALSLVLRAAEVPAALAAPGLALAAVTAPRLRLPLLGLALAAVGLWWGSVRLEVIDASVLRREIGTAGRFLVEVTGPARRGTYTTRVPVEVLQRGGRPLAEAAQLELPAGVRAPPQGARLDLVATVAAPRGPNEPGGFDEAAYLGRRGVHVVLRAPGYRLSGRRGGVGGAADRIRAALAATIAPGLGGERRALVAGIVLGEDEGLDADLRDSFRASGLYHLLAVSGQNVAYLVAGVLVAAWLAGVPRRLAQVAALAAILGYVAAVGWQPSVVRAGIAGGLASLAWLASRPSDRWYFLLVGAAALLAWNPYNLLEPGFQLSFAAVVAIFVLVPRLERRLEGYPVPRRLASVVALSAGCGLATAPILWLQFGSVPLLSVLANALAEPVVAPILGLGLGAAALHPVLPDAALALGWLNGWLVAYLASCARLVGGLPFASVSSRAALGGLAGLVVLAWLAGRPSWRGRRRLALAGGLILILAGAGGWALRARPPALPPPAGLRIAFLDVGQGDSVLLQVPQGAVLVDEGPPEAGVAGDLSRLGVRRLAAVVLTHPQRDHVGGAAAVLRKIPVAAVLDPSLPAESPDEDDALAAARERHVRVLLARAGESFTLGALRLRVVWPDGPGRPGDDPNDHAIVLLASYGEVDALLTADAESNVTGRLALPPVEILKVAHHGSADAGLPALLERLDPALAVISVGARNDYGHPTASTLAALAAAGSRVYRTDRDGTVVVDTDGRRLAVRTFG